jgi:lipoprotein-anchoring transpeptidase ErfK/SrfK
MALTAATVGFGIWWFWPTDRNADGPPRLATNDRNDAAPAVDSQVSDPDRSGAQRQDSGLVWAKTPNTAGESPDPGTTTPNGTPLAALNTDANADDRDEPGAPTRRNEAIARAGRMYEAGQVLEARAELNRLLNDRLTRSEQAEVRRWLTKAAEETIFSTKRMPNDPLVAAYKIQGGDALERIGKQFNVPHEILMTVNSIRDARKIRAGETIKVLNGPFHARIHISEFRLDVYLQDTYVRSFPVGLGADGSTPEGTWRVKNRLPHPTYYPPASAVEKRIIRPHDPANPLGVRWIGLEGAGGNAVGRYGYGIHGTNEPNSVGKAASLGCVRMANDDVIVLYGLLLPGKSTVTILP